MTRILLGALVALAIGSAPVQAKAPPGHHTSGPSGCKAAQGQWTAAQKAENSALYRYYTGANEVKHGQNKESQGESKENAGKRRQQTDPHGQQGKQMEREGKNMQAAGKQQQRDGKAKMSGAERDLHAAWKQEFAEGSASVRDATGCGGPTRPAKI